MHMRVYVYIGVKETSTFGLFIYRTKLRLFIYYDETTEKSCLFSLKSLESGENSGMCMGLERRREKKREGKEANSLYPSSPSLFHILE